MLIIVTIYRQDRRGMFQAGTEERSCGMQFYIGGQAVPCHWSSKQERLLTNLRLRLQNDELPKLSSGLQNDELVDTGRMQPATSQ